MSRQRQIRRQREPAKDSHGGDQSAVARGSEQSPDAPGWLRLVGEGLVVAWALYTFFTYYQQKNFFEYVRVMFAGSP